MLKWVTALITISLGACAVGPDYRRPALDLPAQWNDEVVLTAQERAELSVWWGYFEDPALKALVGRAVARNLNIRLEIAGARDARAAGFRAGRAVSNGGFTA